MSKEKQSIFRFGAINLLVEGDALGIIPTINSSNTDAYIGNLLRDIKGWLYMFDNFKVSHILREGNSLADFMALQGSEALKMSMRWETFCRNYTI